MLDWLADHGDQLDLLISFAMLAVWITYLQLFLQGYRRERRPKILIGQGVGSGLGSRCLLSNMSAESIYVHSLIARLGSSGRQVFAAVTDLVDEDAATEPNVRDATIQGPVAVGGFRDVGTFENILRRAGWTELPSTGRHDPATVDAATVETSTTEPNRIEITVLATYGSEDLIVGASRIFDIELGKTGWTVSPHTADTHQIRSRAKRKALHRAWVDYLN